MKIYPQKDSRAISPVVGIVVIVALTVGVGAIVGGSLFMMGDSAGESAPQAEFTTDVSNDKIIITHVAGESVDPHKIAVNEYPGEDVFTDANGNTYEKISAGDTGEIDGNNTTTVNIQWESESGGTQQSVYSHDLTTTQIEQLNNTTTSETDEETITTKTTLDEGFESGTYTNTFKDTSQSSVSPQVTTDRSNTGEYSLDLSSTPGQTTRNQVTTKNAYENISQVKFNLNKYVDDGGQNHWIVRLNNVSNDRSLELRGSGYYGGVSVREFNKNGDVIYSTTIDSELSANEWHTVKMNTTSDSIIFTTDGSTTEVDTIADWTTQTVEFTAEANSWNNGDNIDVAYDDITIQEQTPPSDETTTETAATVNEGFENKLYTDTFTDISQSSVSPAVSGTNPYEGRYRLNLYSEPGSSSVNRVETTDTYTNVTNVTTQFNKVNDGGDNNNWIMELKSPTDSSRIQITGTSYNSNFPIAVQEVDENGNTLSQATISSTELPQNKWTQITLKPTSNAVEIIIGDNTLTFDTEKNWHQANTKVEFKGNGWNGGDNMDIAIDNFSIKTD